MKLTRVACASILALAAAPDAWAAGRLQVHITAGSQQVAAGSRVFQPCGMDPAAASIALFSKQEDRFSLRNAGDAPLTISRVEVAVGEGMQQEEFTLWSIETQRVPLALADASIPPGQTIDFYSRFYPIASGERSATIRVTHSAGEPFTFTVWGRGRTTAQLLTHGRELHNVLVGAPASDALVTGLAIDAAGNAFLAWNETQVIDRFGTDICLARVNADGTHAWAKVWNGQFRDASPDPGQNSESGGSAGALTIGPDGSLYLCGTVSPSSQNNCQAALVLKIDPANGAILWERVWRTEWVAPNSIAPRHAADAYGLDVAGGRVIVTGATGQGQVFLLGLDASNGAVAFQRIIDPTPGQNDRGYCVRVHGTTAYVGGLAGPGALLMRFTGIDGPRPELAWARAIDLGRGSNVNGIDVDAQGNAYLACDRRGAQTFFSVIKVTPEGALAWGKTHPGSTGNNNVHVVRVVGDTVWVGGKIAYAEFDSQGGDGLILGLSTADGAYRWGAFYYTGKGPDTMCEHRVKGIAVAQDGTIVVAGQAYTGNMNGVRYSGYWYDAPSALEAYAPGVNPLAIPAAQVTDAAQGAVQDAAGMRSYVDMPAQVVVQAAAGKRDGSPPDGDVFLSRIAPR